MLGKVLRITGIILMALTAVVTLLGGIGTSCVAIDATQYGPNMALLADYQWLYILYVVTGVVLGIMGFHATRLLIKSRPQAYKWALTTLVLGLAIGVLHIATSRSLRGSSMPVDAVVYVTALTLVLFLVFRIPSIWRQLNLTGHDDHTSGLGAGVAMIVAGIVIVTVQVWAGSTHTIGGVNYADVWHTQLAIAGGISLLAGSATLLFRVLGVSRPRAVLADSGAEKPLA